MSSRYPGDCQIDRIEVTVRNGRTRRLLILIHTAPTWRKP